MAINILVENLFLIVKLKNLITYVKYALMKEIKNLLKLFVDIEYV